jgi:uncharacterized protein YifN (PemK superfamily)
VPHLSCPVDASHRSFRGKSLTHTTSTIEVDDQATIVSSAVVATDYQTYPLEYDLACVTCGHVVHTARRDNISFDPIPGMIVLCDFAGGFVKPEMVKMRPSIVVSRRDRTGKRTALVVPISTLQPWTKSPVYVPIVRADYPFLHEDGWAKADLVTHVRYGRLKRLKDAGTGALLNPEHTKLTEDHLKAIRTGVLVELGLSTLTAHL